MSKHFTINPKVDLVLERFIDAPKRLVWEALTKPEHLKEWYMPKGWGVVANCELDVRPGGMFSIDIASVEGQEFPNLGCFLEVIPMERLSWTSMLFPGYRPAVFDILPRRRRAEGPESWVESGPSTRPIQRLLSLLVDIQRS